MGLHIFAHAETIVTKIISAFALAVSASFAYHFLQPIEIILTEREEGT